MSNFQVIVLKMPFVTVMKVSSSALDLGILLLIFHAAVSLSLIYRTIREPKRPKSHTHVIHHCTVQEDRKALITLKVSNLKRE